MFGTLGSGGGKHAGGGLGLFMSPRHQDPIRTSERLEGVGHGGVCQTGSWRMCVCPCLPPWVCRRLICGCCGESCDPHGSTHPPVSTDV